ncbi:hypothetical protein HK101_011175 [Irineochytrium annulatum]|nr:hypothetical protein HK101_011175 [Irineochytrium annulatum]
MWVLEGSSGDQQQQARFWLKPGRTYTIGRKLADLLLPHDKSVSRKHGTLTVGPPPSLDEISDVDFRVRVVYKSDAAKLGSKVNGVATGDVPTPVKENDRLDLGNSTHLELKWIPVVICFSAVKANAREELQASARECDLRVLAEVTSSTTHLIVPILKVTIKVVTAVAYCAQIVTQNWVAAIKGLAIANFVLPPERE